MVAVLLVFLGGGVGAVARFGTDRVVSARIPSRVPWGTVAVNMAGSALLGVLLGGLRSPSSDLALLIGTGFCGGLTTFSTFSFETYRLLDEGFVLEAALNVAVSLLVGIGCVTGGFALGQVIF